MAKVDEKKLKKSEVKGDMPPEKRKIPDWARKERDSDMEWIRENVHIFLPAATEQFAAQGRGVIVVDTTQQPTGQGHPFGYMPQSIVEEKDDEDVKRLVREYNPENEFVVVMLKTGNRTSSYRIRPLRK
jgi:hypothetical protein